MNQASALDNLAKRHTVCPKALRTPGVPYFRISIGMLSTPGDFSTSSSSIGASPVSLVSIIVFVLQDTSISFGGEGKAATEMR